MADSAAFANTGEDVIARSIAVEHDSSAENLSPEEFRDYYEIDRTVDELVRGHYKRVCIVHYCPQQIR